MPTFVPGCYMSDPYRQYWALSVVLIYAGSLTMAFVVVIKARAMRIVQPTNVFVPDIDFEMDHFQHTNRIAVALILCAGIFVAPSIFLFPLRKHIDTDPFSTNSSQFDFIIFGLLLCGVTNAFFIGVKHRKIRSAIDDMRVRMRTMSRIGSQATLRLPTIIVSMPDFDGEHGVDLLSSVVTTQGGSIFNQNEQSLNSITSTPLQSSCYLTVQQTVECYRLEPSPFVSPMRERVLVAVGLLVGLVLETKNPASRSSQPQVDDDDVGLKHESKHSERESLQSQGSPYDYQLSQDVQAAAALGQKLQQEIAQNGLAHMREHAHQITKKVHVAGTQEQMDVLKYLEQTYNSYGLETKTSDYEVMLSYPNYNNPNTVSVQLPNGSWSVFCNGLSDVPTTGPQEMIDQISADQRARNWWNGYGADGTASGTLVYANYGRLIDFAVLDKNNISLKGKIVIIRYGELFRGDKVLEAWRRGAVAVIIFTDPIDYGSPDLSNTTNVFPNSPYMPPGGAQRGSIMNVDGDPRTPLYPSKPYTYRLTVDEVTDGFHVPKIPVMPMGYRDAVNLFRNMNGAPVPPDWTGGISGVSYTFTSSVMFQVTVHATTQPRQKIRDVVAYMRGSNEPDKYVLLINHVDSWAYGAMDPNSGTVAMLETARALTTVANATGWRPKRTIVFCSVDAEEFGLIGSTEFAEEYLKVLQQRAVALINIDTAVKGHYALYATATPSLYQTLIRAARNVPNPNPQEIALGRTTVYDSWLYYFPNDSFIAGQPRIKVPDSGSDQSTFLSFVGVPSSYLTYYCDPRIKRDCYELYHTMFEVPWALETYTDPGYSALTAMSQLWTEIARDLSDTLIIPFDINDYASVLTLAVNQLDIYLTSKGIPNIISTYSTIMSHLKSASDRFKDAAFDLQFIVDGINSGRRSASVKQVEMLNSRLMGLERAFINDRGLYPEREDARHVLFATSMHDRYSGTIGAGIHDAVEYYFDAVQDNNATQTLFWLDRIEITISELQYGIESAILLQNTDGYWT